MTSLSKVYHMNITDLTKTHTRPLKGLFLVHVPHHVATYKLGEMINNAVTIYGSPSGYTLYVCNNDLNLYIVDISGSRVTTKRSFVCEANTSLNNVHQSPDGRMLTVTGDSGSIFIADARTPAATVDRIRTSHDSGFGISYHSNEHVLAAAFQDGWCLLYDVRNRSVPLREIRSTRAGHNSGAFRTCKFLRLPVHDLLVVLEHVGRVHVVDLRADDAHQVIVFPFALDQYARYRHERLSMREKLLGRVESEESSEKMVRERQSTRKRNKESNTLDKESEFTTRGYIGEGAIIDADTSAEDETGCCGGNASGGIDTNDRVDHHCRFDVYSDTAAFPAPLVYDADYLADTNPKLFKDYEYHVQMPVAEPEIRFNTPRWSSAPVSLVQECDVGLFMYDGLGSRNNDNTNNMDIPEISENPARHDDVRERLDLETEAIPEPQPYHPRFCHDSYQQLVNHTHGEMELAGVDWFENQLYIGCEDGGVLAWDINVKARRSFGSFSYA